MINDVREVGTFQKVYQARRKIIKTETYGFIIDEEIQLRCWVGSFRRAENIDGFVESVFGADT